MEKRNVSIGREELARMDWPELFKVLGEPELLAEYLRDVEATGVHVVGTEERP